MASSLLALSDLISLQIDRIKLDEFVYKDELQLVRHLVGLDEKSLLSTTATAATTNAATTATATTTATTTTNMKIGFRFFYGTKSCNYLGHNRSPSLLFAATPNCG